MDVVLRGARREPLAGAALTGIISLTLLLAGPGPADAPAHLYRAMLVRDGAFVWDNLWFSGQYPLASYSLLYYLPAAVVGNLPLVFGASITSTVLFSSVARHEWGETALWPSRAFAVLAAAPMFTGLYAYAVGFTTLLGALAALQHGRRRVAIVLGALTLGASPLAFGFLVLVLASVALSRRLSRRAVLTVGGPLAALTLFQVAVMRVFHSGGLYPFHAANLVGVVGVSGAIALLARRTPGSRPIAILVVLWATVSLVLYAVPTPLGDNWTRLSAFIFPVALLTAFLAHWQPRGLAIVTVVGAFAYNVAPYALLVPIRLDTRAQRESFWVPALTYLRQHATPDNRIEIVPTTTHWESYLFPRRGYAIARGWYEQLDMTTNAALYGKRLTPGVYRRWLRTRGVRFVVLPRTSLDSVAVAEGRLLDTGRSGLHVVLRSATVIVFELARPQPILTGAAGAHIRLLSHTALTGSVRTSGRYLLRARYVPYYRVRPAGCVSQAPGGLSWLELPKAGPFVIDVPQSASSLWKGILHGPTTCGSTITPAR